MARPATGSRHDDAAAGILGRLERNLREQVAAEERLLAAVEREQEAMRRLSAEGLKSALSQAAGEVTALSRLAEERRRLMNAVARPGEVPAPAEKTWETALAGAAPERRAALAALRQRARDLAERLAAANRVSGRASERVAAHVAALLAAVAGGRPSTYAPNGPCRAAVRTGRPNSLIDRVA